MERTLDYRTALLDDATLVQRLHALVALDRRTCALMLAHLGELDARGLHRDAGYSSLFAYCTEALHMSESEGALRIRAARLARRFPEVLQHVERGELHLSALRVLAPVLDESNHQRLLDAAVHKTREEVELLVAELAPKPDVPERVRKLPSLPAAPAASSQAELLPTVTPSDASELPSPAAVPASRPSARPSAMPRAVAPLGEARYSIQLTASQALHDKLRQAQELLRHRIPNGDLAAVFEVALERLVRDLKKERFGNVERPRKSKAAPKPDSRHVPHEVRREVVERDGERCTFVSADGHRCKEVGMLEFHHELPYARKGPTTVGNVRLMCRAHNALLAERDFGRAFMERARSRQRDATAQQTLWCTSQVLEPHQV